ncbi:AraC family transcriptional regulator [Pandoraea anapnoica]|uniref:AraC family transcriptional regulator n=1 Tax=Pandoraea anapnoica TaxID=2508301 RepID=A0A5E4ZZU3_9BURK|nr:AraC family transcriptional regulator [Pandoraea anapnoica]VVE66834.1 AraC family transcriptional regulator [Pandoraea anapnoica]
MSRNLYSPYIDSPYLDYGNLSDDLTAAPGTLLFPDSAAARVEQVGNGHHYRLEYCNGYADGRTEFHAQSPAMWMTYADVSFKNVVRRRTHGRNTLRIRISRRGACSYSIDGKHLSLDGPNVGIVAEPENMLPGDVSEQGHHQVTSLCIHRDALRGLYAGEEASLPVPIQHFLDGSLRQSFMHSAPIAPDMLDCLQQLADCSMEGRHRSLFLQARSLEILARAMASISDGMNPSDDEHAHPEVSRMTRRAVSKAQVILQENFVTPPCLDTLSRQVGLSRSSLCAGFRTLVGKSIYEYAHELRMQQALRLLREPGVPVTDVAYAVGYQHPSSFSVAIQKRFGLSPRALRSRSAGGGVSFPD